MAQNGKNLLNGISRSGLYFTWDGAQKQLTYLTENSNYSSMALKIQLFNGNTYVNQIKVQTTQGNGYVTFTKDSTWNKLNVGFNGSSQDGQCLFDCSGLTNGATYTLTWNIQNFTWKEKVRAVMYRTGAIFRYLVLTQGSTVKYWDDIVPPIAIWNDIGYPASLSDADQTVVAEDETGAVRTYRFNNRTYYVYADIVDEPTQTYVEGQSIRYVDIK